MNNKTQPEVSHANSIFNHSLVVSEPFILYALEKYTRLFCQCISSTLWKMEEEPVVFHILTLLLFCQVYTFNPEAFCH